MFPNQAETIGGAQLGTTDSAGSPLTRAKKWRYCSFIALSPRRALEPIQTHVEGRERTSDRTRLARERLEIFVLPNEKYLVSFTRTCHADGTRTNARQSNALLRDATRRARQRRGRRQRKERRMFDASERP